MIAAPLQVVLCWRLPERAPIQERPAFIAAADRAFRGRSVAGDALPNWIAGTAAESLVFREFSGVPKAGVLRKLLTAAHHTLIIAWIDVHLASDPDFIRWLGQVWDAVEKSNGANGVLLACPDTRLRNEFLRKAAELKVDSLADCQLLNWEQLGEEAARPAAVSLLALQKSRELLSHGLGQPGQRLSLFVSHAKHDGLSFAEALTRAVGNVPRLESFYDARDILPGTNWKTELRRAVGASALVAVRTDGYDERPWCNREVQWAEELGAPMVVVDARFDLYQAPSTLPWAAAPSVRIPDGSVTRVLYCALYENLRLLMNRRGVRALGPDVFEASVVLPRSPSFASLEGALSRLPASNVHHKYIVYPDPKLGPQMSEALERFVAVRSQNTFVRNYSRLLAEKG